MLLNTRALVEQDPASHHEKRLTVIMRRRRRKQKTQELRAAKRMKKKRWRWCEGWEEFESGLLFWKRGILQ